MSVMNRTLSLRLLISIVLLELGCGHSEAPTKGSTPVPSQATAPSPLPSARFRSASLTQPPLVDDAAPSPRLERSYRGGAWRLANRASLNQVVLWVDHIVIRHATALNEVSFNLAYWYSVQRSQRTRDEALALARRIVAEAREAKVDFAELARRYSDDLPSREGGGALGGIPANELSDWPEVLDALAALHSGQVSEVVETSYGFHVFRRREPPAERSLSGAHIVIGHDDAEWLKVQARGPLPSRTREDARALASEIYRELQARPERFRELVERYSEHRDAVISGDFGSWSTREPNPFPARMLRLQVLEVGKIGAPIETPFGFEIIQRTEVGAREQYAVRALRLQFEPSAADAEATSRASVAKQAEALANTYAAEPQRFADATVLQWQSGRGVPALEVQVRELEIGAVAKSPVQTEFSFQISQRVAPRAVDPVRYETELPQPESPDIQFHLSHMEPESLRALLRASTRRLPPGLRLQSKKLARVQALCESARFANPDDSAQANATVQRFLSEMKSLLGPEGYDIYFVALQRELTSALLETETPKR